MSDQLEQCENCGTSLEGEFCHICGQRGIDLKRPVIGLAQDLIVDTLWIDSRMWRTVIGLLVNPGKIAKSYLSGKRVVYTPPFRVFLFSSLLFFAIFFLSITIGKSNMLSDFQEGWDNADSAEEEQSQNDEAGAVPGIATPEIEPIEAEVNETDDDVLEIDYSGPESLRPFVTFFGKRINEAIDDPRLFISNSKDNIPRALFFSPIIYLILLLIFYFYRKNIRVYDCLIISFYMHAALYFYLAFVVIFQATPLNNIIILNWSDDLVQFWGIIQSYRVLSTNFSSRWWSVLIKGTLINIIYWVSVMLLTLAGMAISLVG